MEHRQGEVLSIIIILILIVVIAQSTNEITTLREKSSRANELAVQVERQNRDLVEAVVMLREEVLHLHEQLADAQMETLVCKNQGTATTIPPRIRVPLSSFLIDQNTVRIDVKNVIAGIVAPTGSMEPILGTNTTVLEIIPGNPSDIFPGDIIIYELDGHRIIHRVISVGWDIQGWYAVTKGDNNSAPDPSPVRFPQVKGLVVAIIY